MQEPTGKNQHPPFHRLINHFFERPLGIFRHRWVDHERCFSRIAEKEMTAVGWCFNVIHSAEEGIGMIMNAVMSIFVIHNGPTVDDGDRRL